MTEYLIPDAASLDSWRKSSYSGPDADSCLEVLDGHPAYVPVRDSKTPHGPATVFAAASWGAFVSAVKDGTLDAEAG
ncbi:DUF397 domain-containing protein [Streptomyces alboflavus]|uniref:DUF397 domain-containing protein n=1 Tax=Streptomyces alboflavus TaxID=67267 RepID=UPI0036CC48C0